MKGVRVDRERVLKLHRQGLSATVIATRMGISGRAVLNVVQLDREARAAAEQGAAA